MINFPPPKCAPAVINSLSVLFSERNIRHDDLPVPILYLLDGGGFQTSYNLGSLAMECSRGELWKAIIYFALMFKILSAYIFINLKVLSANGTIQKVEGK